MSETKKLTNALLKEKMTDAMVDRGYCRNLDAVNQSGYYSVGTATPDRPGDIYGTMQCLITSTFRSQIIYATNGCIYMRTGQTAWPSSWLKTSLTIV